MRCRDSRSVKKKEKQETGRKDRIVQYATHPRYLSTLKIRSVAFNMISESIAVCVHQTIYFIIKCCTENKINFTTSDPILA